MSCPAQKVADLFIYFDTDPCIQSCFKRLLNVIMTEPCTVKERNQAIKPELNKKLMTFWRRFVYDAMKMAFVCGFVPFYTVMHQDFKIPMVLAPGTFSWTVEVVGKEVKRRKFELPDKCTRFVIQLHNTTVQEKDVVIVNFGTPICCNNNRSSFPIQALYTQHLQLQHVQSIIQESNVWNKEKHVAITEQFDLKDQTTSGIELLDEVRRYTLTGQSGIAPIVRMRRANGSDQDSLLHSINDANMHWLHKQFEGDGTSTASARFHLLPANMNIAELSTINVGAELQLLLQQYRVSVHDFFDMPNTDQAAGHSNAVVGAQISRQQYNQILATNEFIESLLAIAYKMQFDLDDSVSVQVSMHPQSRMEINTFADIKAIGEMEGFLSASEKQQIKSLFLKKN